MQFEENRDRIFRFLLAFAIFIIIAIPVMERSLYLRFIDISLIGDVQKHENLFLNLWYHLVSALDSPKIGVVWILIIAFLLWGFKYKLQSLWAMGTLFSGDVLDELIKHIVRRPRPVLHPAADVGYSFPSGHVFSTVLIISVLWILAVPLIQRHRLRIAAQVFCWAWVIMVMLARVYVNAHYPTDVLGALAMAYAWLQVCEWLYIRLAPRMKQWPLLRHSYF